MRAILCAVLLLAAASASADMVKVTQTTDAVYYLDTASISVKGDFRLVSVVQDYATQQRSGGRSARVSYDIDCTSERLRSVAVTEYSQPMAQGERLGSLERDSEWLYVGPRTGSNLPSRTPYRPILKFVCSRQVVG